MKDSIRALFTCAVVATASLGSAAFAAVGGGCHFHGDTPASQQTVVDCASKRKDALITSGKLDASWKPVRQDKVEQIEGKKGKEWKVSFKNASSTDKTKDTLYMFFSLPGNFLAANFTGK